MYNYEHEISQVKNRFLKYYIWFDYFHDSLIKNIDYFDENKVLNIDLSCEREWPSHNWKLFADDNNYIYRLSFIDCVYFEYEHYGLKSSTEYLNGRFKNSARLKEINQLFRSSYYHLRIQLSCGYIDLIFHGFKIERVKGDVYLPKRINCKWHFDYVVQKLKDKSVDEVLTLASEGEFPLKSYALDYLWMVKHDKIVDLAQNALLDEDARISAVFILGELGSIDNIKDLAQLMCKNDFTPVFKRQIKDSIEKILCREG